MTTRYTNRFAVDPTAAAMMDTETLRANFLIKELFVPGAISLNYTNYDRMVIGGAVPGEEPLTLEAIRPTGTENFLDRRELIVVNMGEPGTVTADDTTFALGTHDMLYLGKGTVSVVFASDSAGQPARFYLVSAPAHAELPATLIRIGDAKRLDLGSKETANERSIFQFIHPEGARTCQLVVGMTRLAEGSVWNTMPCHVHDRRSEAYLYFGLPEAARVLHLMGEPTETRHLVVANEQAVLSPNWSIHAGAGTGSYGFVWAMAGDNVDYTDVELVDMAVLR